jgi:hypothetical protein
VCCALSVVVCGVQSKSRSEDVESAARAASSKFAPVMVLPHTLAALTDPHHPSHAAVTAAAAAAAAKAEAKVAAAPGAAAPPAGLAAAAVAAASAAAGQDPSLLGKLLQPHTPYLAVQGMGCLALPLRLPVNLSASTVC